MEGVTRAVLGVRIRKTFLQRKAPAFSLDVDFAVHPGVTILFGASGAGKSTILQCIAGLCRPDAGRIASGERVLFDSAARTNARVAQREVGYVFQRLALFPHLTIEQNAAYGIRHENADRVAQRVNAVLESFHVANLRTRLPREVSGGEAQRVALARALVTEPRVLLLDEPLTALDAHIKAGIIDDLRAWNLARGIPILYITHNHDEVFALGERVIVLQQGRIIAQGAPLDVLQMPRHEAVAQLAGFENIFDATVVALHEQEGTMTCRIAGTPVELVAPLTRLEMGASIRLAVRAGEILLAGVRPQMLSARNIIPAQVTQLTRVGMRVEVRVNCGAEFLVHLTPGAIESLRLRPGSDVWMVLKSHSCHLIHGNGRRERSGN
jgi:molybdate transport system ATP-binding protein